ncbi:hypothetical protein ACJVDH_10690 [Pedobacter sp. AW1-32]|uniref:hypothetical protein n=1 Tax=Pedobacter sp. AW1-32 TaxID=3383026 RepID=UPI003FF15461
MEELDLRNLSDEELLQEAKKMKSAVIINAVLVGFLVGVIAFSVFKNTWGLLTLIPLFFVYKLANGSKAKNEALEGVLKERNLKI